MLQGKTQEKLRLNARAAWWLNLDEVTADSELQATFHLKRRQPSFLALLASGFTPVYPCHVGAGAMRQHPIGTGPFKFVEFKPNQSIKVVQEPGLLETGPALSRRRRVDDHPQPVDRDPRFYRRQFRHDLSL